MIPPSFTGMTDSFQRELTRVREQYFSRNPDYWPVFRDPTLARVIDARRTHLPPAERLAAYPEGAEALAALRGEDRMSENGMEPGALQDRIVFAAALSKAWEDPSSVENVITMPCDPATAPGTWCLWYDQPARTWMAEALPIGNGPMGAMLFGDTETERIQFNEISLWTGDRMAGDGDMLGDTQEEKEQNLGDHQAFGDIFIHLGHDFSKVTHYRQELDIDRAVHQVTYEYNGVRYRRTAFASHPDGVIVVHLTADKPAAHTGHVQLADMHDAKISGEGNKLSSVGKLKNGFEYEAQLSVRNENGTVALKSGEAPSKNPWDIAVPTTSLACSALGICF